MNQCYMEQDTNSTPVCDGCCQIGFLFLLRMWNIYITSSIGGGGVPPSGAAVTAGRVTCSAMTSRAKVLTFNAVIKEVVIFHRDIFPNKIIGASALILGVVQAGVS